MSRPVPDEAREILEKFRRVAVVGISEKPERPSNGVARYLKAAGYTIIPINPGLGSVLGVPCYPRLAAAPAPIEVVDVFRRSSEAGAVVDEAIAAGAKAVWLQDGVIDELAAVRARRAGLLVAMDRCMMRDHAALSR